MTKNIKCVALAADCFLVGAFLGLTAVAGVVFLGYWIRARWEDVA